MSAFGPKQTWSSALTHVRFWGKSRHGTKASQYPLKTQNGCFVVVTWSAWNRQCAGCGLLTLRFLMRWFCRVVKSLPLGALVSSVGEAFPSGAGEAISSGIDFGRSPTATTWTTL